MSHKLAQTVQPEDESKEYDFLALVVKLKNQKKEKKAKQQEAAA